jgi:hypothetical protein
MSFRVKKSKRRLSDEKRGSSLQRKISEDADDTLEIVSLKDVPLEERRREAKKPLFLTRYE